MCLLIFCVWIQMDIMPKLKIKWNNTYCDIIWVGHWGVPRRFMSPFQPKLLLKSTWLWYFCCCCSMLYLFCCLYWKIKQKMPAMIRSAIIWIRSQFRRSDSGIQFIHMVASYQRTTCAIETHVTAIFRCPQAPKSPGQTADLSHLKCLHHANITMVQTILWYGESSAAIWLSMLCNNRVWYIWWSCVC